MVLLNIQVCGYWSRKAEEHFLVHGGSRRGQVKGFQQCLTEAKPLYVLCACETKSCLEGMNPCYHIAILRVVLCVACIL